MELEKIQNIKISLMEVADDTNINPKKLDFVIRSSVSINLENLEFDRSEESIKTISDDMFGTLTSLTNIPTTDYIGIWVKYDGEVFDNSIKIQTLEDIKEYSVEEVNALYEFIKMTLPE